MSNKPHLLVHPCEREVCPGQVSGQFPEGSLHQVLDSQPLVLGDSGRQTETVDTAADLRVERNKSTIDILI